MCLQRRFTSELLVVALGALTAWSAFICRGRVPVWLQALWGGRITEDSFYELAHNAPVKVMVNGRGVDHFEDALDAYAAPCLG